MYIIELMIEPGALVFISEDAAAVLKRASMDRRRFEDAHLKYAALKIVSWYPNMLELLNP